MNSIYNSETLEDPSNIRDSMGTMENSRLLENLDYRATTMYVEPFSI